MGVLVGSSALPRWSPWSCHIRGSGFPEGVRALQRPPPSSSSSPSVLCLIGSPPRESSSMQLIPLPPNEVLLAVACIVVRRQHGWGGGGMCHFSQEVVCVCVGVGETQAGGFISMNKTNLGGRVNNDRAQRSTHFLFAQGKPCPNSVCRSTCLVEVHQSTQDSE